MPHDTVQRDLSPKQAEEVFLKNYRNAESKIDCEFKAGVVCISRTGDERGTEFSVLIGGHPVDVTVNLITMFDRLANEFPECVGAVLDWTLKQIKNEVAEEIRGVLAKHEKLHTQPTQH